ncbi:unnamed protein product [Kluyveromyces dobzhanskii CBS 2104]|uniref:WGS project CCBQ000000000 data, contig MAT n=1 Tax=Kluyveromyces dobzhanskii CBS 2104 TaxID=1427455 RepID=A0A0A8L1X3_9SACH|nr:unnamed protein product [Kluyveromyces dobzhanskii CBS 2104]
MRMNLLLLSVWCLSLLNTAVAVPWNLYKPTRWHTNWVDVITGACLKDTKDHQWGFELETLASTHGTFLLQRRSLRAACLYEPAMETWISCSRDMLRKNGKYPKSKDDDKLLETLAAKANSVCEQNWSGKNPVPPLGAEDVLNKIQNATLHIQQSPGNEQTTLYAPIKGIEGKLDYLVTAYYGPVDNLDFSTIGGFMLCGYWILILFIAAIYKLILRYPRTRDLLKSKFFSVVDGRIVIPALVHSHATPVGWPFYFGMIPTRLETLTILGYTVLHTVLMTTRYYFDIYHLVSDPKVQKVLFVVDRAGIYAFAQLPVLFLFGGRNQLLEMLTGIKFRSFVVYHKWIGRFMFWDSAVHSIGYTYHAFMEDYWKYAKNSATFQSGRFAMWYIGGIILFSFFFFRNHYYEFFLLSHILLVTLVLVFLWKHCGQIGWNEFLVVTIFIWALDRLFRAWKIILFRSQIATLQLLQDSYIRISIPITAKSWNAKPGQYCYIHFIKPTMFWQAHPFSVMDSLVHSNNLVIVLAVKEGATRRLRDYIPFNGKIQMRVAVEGPYGEPIEGDMWNNALLIAGGTGIPSSLAFAVKTLEHDVGLRQTSIRLVWSLRDLTILNCYVQELQVLKANDVNLQIYYTGEHEIPVDKSIEANSEEDNEGIQLLDPDTPYYNQIIKHRPNIPELFEESLEISDELLVVSCGSGPFVDKVREVSGRKTLQHPDKLINYIEDLQVW